MPVRYSKDLLSRLSPERQAELRAVVAALDASAQPATVGGDKMVLKQVPVMTPCQNTVVSKPAPKQPAAKPAKADHPRLRVFGIVTLGMAAVEFAAVLVLTVLKHFAGHGGRRGRR